MYRINVFLLMCLLFVGINEIIIIGLLGRSNMIKNFKEFFGM